LIVLLELKLENWVKAGLALYKSQPLLTELVFTDASHHADAPTALGPGFLSDTTQRWLPDEFAPIPRPAGGFFTGFLRWADQVFPLLGNAPSTLTLTGDPSLVEDVEGIGYQIVPPSALALNELLATRKFVVASAFPQVPVTSPTFVLRLQSDQHGQAYIDEMVDNYVPALTGIEHSINRQDMVSTYLMAIVTANRLETLWLYAWLMNYATHSIQQFGTWGMYDVAFSGSDLGQDEQYLPEHVAVRHFLLTCTRPERALTLATLERVTDLDVDVDAQYARFRETLVLP
jgi:hypothetical protein